MKSLSCSFLSLLGVLAALLPAGRTDAAPFTAGNLAVLRAGDGAAVLSGSATAIFIDEYSPAGVLAQSIPIPAAAGGTMLTVSGSATSEGSLVRSPNGALLCFAGYKAPAGLGAVAATTAAANPREVGTMDVSGTFAVAASTATQFSGANIRGGVTDGANNFWGSGTGSPLSTGGVNYLGTAAVPGQLLSANLRWANIFNGSLYFSSGSTTPGLGIHQFAGLPVAASASSPVVVLAAGASPYGFSVNPAGNIMYIADDRVFVAGGSAGGIQRWNKVGAAWSFTYTLGTGGGSTAGARGLVVNWSGAAPVIYATTTDSPINRLITVTDTGAGSVAATLASVGANRAFRGVAFAPAVLRTPKPRFFTTNVLPPAGGVNVSAAGAATTYANGIITRNISQKLFTQSLPPPPLGGTQVHNFGATVEMDVSQDGGQTFLHVSAPANVSVRVTHTSDSAATGTFDTEMLQLDISSFGAGGGFLIRESPSRASTGRTTIETVGGGFMIDSFFDIFTELSLDGGQTWSPAPDPTRVDGSVDPTLIPPVSAPSPLFPPPNDIYASTAQYFTLFPQGVITRNAKHRFFTQSLPATVLIGQSQLHTFSGQMDMEISTDGGQTFVQVRVPTSETVRLTHTRDEGTTQIFETEMLQLDLTGGGLSAGMMFRESPTKQSQGGTAIAPLPDGLFQIDSFFDVFTELSLDGGQNWSPSSAPGHLELQSPAPEVAGNAPNLPPLSDQYVSSAAFDAVYAAGLVLKGTILSNFTQSQPPPPPGGSQVHSTACQVQFQVSQDGGQTFQAKSAPAQLTFQVRSSVDSGSTRFFDTEMLALNISGGTLPPGVMVRESPSKASLGRTSERQLLAGSYMIDSFFDVFTELSLDGGQTWQPSELAPMEVVLTKVPQPAGTPHFFTTSTLPPPNGLDAGAAGSVFATYANGIIVQGFAHRTFSQSLTPPAFGLAQTNNFTSTVGMDVSMDGGQTYQRISAPATASVRVTHSADSGSTSFFDTEMLALNISGGGLPAGVMVRESPTRASTGRTSIESVPGGFMIGSFFDIFTECSLDGGQTWSPSALSGHVEGAPDPALIAPVSEPTTLLPPPNSFFASTASFYALFNQGVVLRNVKQLIFTQSQAAPALGQSQVQSFSSQVDMQVSTDGGQTFVDRRAPGSVSMRVTHTRNEGTTQFFDTEMLALDLVGGGLPQGLMLRESPTKQSQGGTAISPQTDGTYRVHSFFDIFTEVSLDGGQNWSPATAPGHLELRSPAPEVAESTQNLPPSGGTYASAATLDAAYAGGFLLQNTRLDQFSQSTPPPPPGGGQNHVFTARVQFMISGNGGASFSPATATANAVLRVTSFQDEGSTRFFDTEMLALNISGGTLPAGVMLRESPTKVSAGRTSIRQIPPAGGYMIDSFFDIFTELSVNGGQTWQPSTTAPLELTLQDTAGPDSDHDGLPDAWELTYFGSLAQGPNDDYDHDGSPNGYEYLAGTNPANPASVLIPASSASGLDLKILIPTVSGHQYTIECSTNLTTSSWAPVITGIIGDGNIQSILLRNGFSFIRRYYRVIPSLSP